MRVVGREFPDVRVEFLHGENIEAGIDLANLLLRRACRLLFDDRLALRRFAALLRSTRPYPVGFSSSALSSVIAACSSRWKLRKPPDRLRRDQRRVTREHDDVVIPSQRLPSHHERVARAALLGLQHKVDAGVLHRRAHPLGLVADDRVDILRRNDTHRRADHVLQQRLAPDFM